jgi:hypothetical protein
MGFFSTKNKCAFCGNEVGDGGLAVMSIPHEGKSVVGFTAPSTFAGLSDDMKKNLVGWVCEGTCRGRFLEALKSNSG